MTPIIYLMTTGGGTERSCTETGGAAPNGAAKIDRYLQSLHLPGLEVNIVPLMEKNGSEMAGQDRTLILGIVRAMLKENAPIVITHCLETVIATGLYLERALSDLRTPIILTGAVSPWGLPGGDGLQNITESLMAAQLVGPGVYIVVHGTCFPVKRVRQDRVRGRFVWADELT